MNDEIITSIANTATIAAQDGSGVVRKEAVHEKNLP
jgi:hypothetical protein